MLYEDQQKVGHNPELDIFNFLTKWKHSNSWICLSMIRSIVDAAFYFGSSSCSC